MPVSETRRTTAWSQPQSAACPEFRSQRSPQASFHESRTNVATSPLAAGVGLFEETGEAGVAAGTSGSEVTAAIKFAGKQGRVAAGDLGRRMRRQLVDEGYGPTIYALAKKLAPACNSRELRRLDKLVGVAYQYDNAATSRPRNFVAFVDAARVRDPIAADVRVMTVHQAKGLEFDIVVLAELETRLIGQRDDLVVGRPTPTAPIDRVSRRCSGDVQQLMPESWQRLFRQVDDQDVAESLCVLYVAVTRAVHALHIVVEPSGKSEKSLHKTFGGVLRAALTDGNCLAPEQVAYETGDREWYKKPGVKHEPSAAEVAVKAESLVPLNVKLAAPAERRWRGLERVSPSSLEGGTHVRLSDQWSDTSADRTGALVRGTLIHAWFEQIEWLEDGLPSDDRLREVASSLPDLDLQSEDIARWLADFHAMVAKPHIGACLERNHYKDFSGHALKVETERPLAVCEGERLLVGNIDRLVTIYEGDQPIAADILDFKTDGIVPGDDKALANKVEFYGPQISAYRSAVCAVCRLEASQVSAKLLFVNAGSIERL